MRIVVCIKHVPDVQSERRIEDGRLVRGEEDVLNELDENAVEAAVALAEEADGEVIALTMGPEDAEDGVRRALQMGADSGVVVADDDLAGADVVTTARVLAAAIERIGEVDLVIGTHNIHKLIDLIKEKEGQKESHMLATEMEDNVFHAVPTKRFQKFFAWVPIMNGCNKFCTYCIVPYVRGREVSRPLEEIVEEIRNLAKEGYKEITLLGQNVNSYGLDFKDGTDFSALLYAIEDIDGIERVRYMTSHPKDMTFTMIDAIAQCKKVVSHIHLPVQSGSTELLKRMNRGYTTEHYEELVSYIREKMPQAVLTTDIIVGFPGETEAMFQETLDLLRRVRYDMAYTFIYSPRTGTPAATMDNQIPQDEKSRRLKRLADVQNEISLAYNVEMEGKDYEVIVEGPTKNDENHWFGRTRGNKMIIWENDGTSAVGDTIRVHVDKGQTWVLKGHVLKREEDCGRRNEVNAHDEAVSGSQGDMCR